MPGEYEAGRTGRGNHQGRRTGRGRFEAGRTGRGDLETQDRFTTTEIHASGSTVDAKSVREERVDAGERIGSDIGTITDQLTVAEKVRREQIDVEAHTRGYN